jgi:hypothetical protein
MRKSIIGHEHHPICRLLASRMLEQLAMDARLIRRISARRSASICGRPPRKRDFQRQYRRKPGSVPSHEDLGADNRDGLED